MTADSSAFNIHPRDLPEAHLKNFKRQLVPLAFRKTLKVSPTNWLLSAVIYKRRLLVTMDSSKRIIIFICVWLILSCVLLDHSQGFEVWLTKKTRPLKHKPRKTQGNHHHYVKQMADLFSRFVVCMKGKNALFVCLQGHPTTIFGRISVRKTIWDLEFSKHLL